MADYRGLCRFEGDGRALLSHVSGETVHVSWDDMPAPLLWIICCLVIILGVSGIGRGLGLDRPSIIAFFQRV